MQRRLQEVASSWIPASFSPSCVDLAAEGSALAVKRVDDVGAQIVLVFETDRKPDQAVGEAMFGALLRRISRMGHAGGVLDQGLGVAEADRARDEIERVHESLAGREAALQFERDHAAKRLHLPAGERFLRMAVEAGVVNLPHAGMSFQIMRQPHRACAMAVHPQRKGFQAAQHEKGVERRDAGAIQFLDADEAELVDQFLARDNGAGQQVAVAAEIFCRGMDDDIGAKRDRALR